MNRRQIIYSVLLVDFLLLSGYIVLEYGYIEIFRIAWTNLGATQIFVDLCMSLGLIAAWMIKDAREKGISVAPFLALTVVLGSVGPLAYLIRRERAPSAAVERTAPTSARTV